MACLGADKQKVNEHSKLSENLKKGEFVGCHESTDKQCD